MDYAECLILPGNEGDGSDELKLHTQLERPCRSGLYAVVSTGLQVWRNSSQGEIDRQIDYGLYFPCQWPRRAHCD